MSNFPRSRRDDDIIRHIAAGRSNQEIARLLSLATTTVKGHVQNLLRRYQADTRAHLVALAYERGDLVPEKCVCSYETVSAPSGGPQYRITRDKPDLM